MRVPQVSERVKELPAQALRGVFAGIGQVLLLTDKLMNKTPPSQQAPQARGPERKEPAAEASKAAPAPETAKAAPTVATAPAAKAAPAANTAKATPVAKTAPATKTAKAASAGKAPEARDLDKTGNVRLLAGAGSGSGAGGATQAAGVPVTAEVPVTLEAEEAAEAPAAEAPGTEEATAPLPNYDELSVPSLRARLRNLDAAQVKQMAEYERAHAARADVIAMFERRIAKLEAGG